MLRNRTVAAAVTMALGLGTACVGDIEGPEDEELIVVSLDDAFQNAADEFGVPVEILKSIGYVETGWEMIEGEAHDNRPAAFGVMAVRDDVIDRAAELAGVDADDVRFDEESNIRAAAALLRSYADEEGVNSLDITEWAPVIGRYSGVDDESARQEYVHRDVLQTVKLGAELMAEDGQPIATLDAVDIAPADPGPGMIYASTSDYRAAIWRPSPNNSARSSGSIGKIAMVIIHTCEGGYSGCWGWLRNSRAGASAHYVVKENGKEITQLVREYRKAWHIAASYSCSRNGGVDCWRNGYNSNNFTIGIEHAGYASQRSFPSGQIEASAKLVCDITRDRGIKRDRRHIVGHGQLQPWNRTDPGKNWPWTHYINRVRAHCGSGGGGGGGGGTSGGGGGTSGGGFVVDSNNSKNNSSKAKMVVSGNWAASNSTSGYWGTGYWYASTKPVGDAAEFRFYMSADGYKTIDAWYTAGTNRSPRAPFIAFDSSGKKLGTKYVNQQTNGKRWVTLGKWRFKKGWNKVVLSRWAAEGKVVIADAVRVR